MAIKKITYQDKIGIVPKTVQINQVWDDDMNEIKNVVNTNADQTTQNTNDISAIMGNPVAAINVSAIPSLVYLIGTNVQAQLNQTEANLVGLYKLDKEDSKSLYQTGRDRVDTDNSVLSIVPTDTLRITNCDDILFVNEIVVNSSSNKIGDYVKSFGLVDFIASSTNTPLASNTRGIFYVGLNKLGTQVYRTSKVYDQDVCYLARILVENTAGVYTIVSFKYIPDLSSNRMNRRDRFVQQSGYLVPSGAASISFGNRAVSFYKSSINYSNNKLDPNYLTIADSVNPTPMQFLFILPNVTSLAVAITPTTTIDPSVWYNASGTAGAGGIAAANYQVYNVLLTVTGNILIQVKASTSNAPAPGVNAIFGSREDALAGLDTVVFPEILPAGDSIVLGTFYLRAGTNLNGSQLNLSSDFYFKPKVVSSSSSIVGVTSHDLLSGKNDNPAFQHVTSADITNWNNAYTNRITSLTTTGTSGPATLIGNVLNIPVYAPQSGSANYINSQNAIAQVANMWINGNAQFDGNVGIGKAPTSDKLSVNGNITAGQFIRDGGTASQFLKADGSIDSTSYATASGSASYIQNQNASAQTANMWINGTGKFGDSIGLLRDAGSIINCVSANGSIYTPLGFYGSAFNFNVGDIVIVNSDSRIRGGDNLGRLLLSNSSTTSYIHIGGSTTYTDNIDIFSTAGGINLTTNSLVRVTVLNNGNVGIGNPTPGTSPNNTLLGFPQGSNIQGRKAYPQLAMSSNIDGDYYNATYKTNNPASQIVVDALGGAIALRVAPAGTAGNSIAWTDARTVYFNNAGNLGVGTSGQTNKFHVNGNLLSGNENTWAAKFSNGSISKGLAVGYDEASDCGVIGSIHDGVNWKNTSINPHDGNLLVGTKINNGQKLQIAGPLNSFGSTMRLTNTDTGNYITISGGIPGVSNAGLEIAVDGVQRLSINGAGNMTVTGSVTASGNFFNSDLRLKDIISRDNDVIYFKWKDQRDDKLHIGYGAQEVREYMPDAINVGEDNMLSVNYTEVLVSKIRLLEKEVEALKSKLN